MSPGAAPPRNTPHCTKAWFKTSSSFSEEKETKRLLESTTWVLPATTPNIGWSPKEHPTRVLDRISRNAKCFFRVYKVNMSNLDPSADRNHTASALGGDQHNILPAFRHQNWRTARKAICYAIFAVIAVCGNIGTQTLIDQRYRAASFAVSLFCGTAIGLIIKYTLDKIWIFNDSFELHPRELKKLTLYSMFGVITTAIFWSSETLSWLIWHNYALKYAGAVFGLTIGYTLKYTLDRHITFRKLA